MILIPKANKKRTNFPCWKDVVDSEGKRLLPIIYCKCGKPLPLHSLPKEIRILCGQFKIINGIVGPLPVRHYTTFPDWCGFDDYLKLVDYEE